MASSNAAVKDTTKKPKPMPKKQLAHFEKRLLEERKRVIKELGHHGDTFGPNGEADGDTSAYSFHMADQGTDAMERIAMLIDRVLSAPEDAGVLEATRVDVRALADEFPLYRPV